MSTSPIKINDSLFCLANDWKKGEHRYYLELSKTEDPKNTILVVGSILAEILTLKRNILAEPSAVCAIW